MGDIRRSVTETPVPPITCSSYPHADHTDCPSSVECVQVGLCPMCGCPTLRDGGDHGVRHMVGVGAIYDEWMALAQECRTRVTVIG